ncbi:hypothetical protein BC941DRAFT_517504 [Chlamydoabsidia padenii]|nr:hypothetical protein BC941DRAFT_517504 [Chlamydoabsidia padenii]
MGLAGQKVKQRISMDPNNLHWSNDTSKFGFRMMAKMGWAPGKGLGLNEDGKQQHVKIKLKDDNLGLGAKKNQTENWLGNTDAFSRLLADLNSQEAASPVTEEENDDSDNADKQSDNTSTKKRKATDSVDDEKAEKKKAKKAKKDKKDKKSKKDKKDESTPAVVTPMTMRNAARAKFLKAKRMATQHDPARLNEILGIKA